MHLGQFRGSSGDRVRPSRVCRWSSSGGEGNIDFISHYPSALLGPDCERKGRRFRNRSERYHKCILISGSCLGKGRRTANDACRKPAATGRIPDTVSWRAGGPKNARPGKAGRGTRRNVKHLERRRGCEAPTLQPPHTGPVKQGRGNIALSCHSDYVTAKR